MKFIFLVILFLTPCFASSSLNLELGQVENSYNRVAIPGNTGTPFNMASSFDEKYFYYRLSFIQKLRNPRHGLRFLYAPLNIKGEDTYSKDIDFQGVRFDANEKLDTEYQFNSYRATYFYQVIQKNNFLLNLGGTLKIRDAKVGLKQGSREKVKYNTGLVPLLYLYSEYKWENGFRAAFDFDGMAAPQGRAFDVALMGGYYFSSNFHANLGYRVVEGGADNDKVYTFAQFNYWFTALQLDF